MSAGADTLYACPVCGQPNFSWRGLRAHCCRAKPDRARLTTAELIKAGRTQPLSMPKAKSSSSPEAALATIGGALSTKAQLAKFKKVVAKQIGLVMRVERENIHRRLFVGLALLCIKDALHHGEWLPWLKANAPGASSMRQCHYMMAAARVWIEEQELGEKDLAALSGGGFSLDLKSTKLAALVKSVDAFVGDMTWGELLAAHGLRAEEDPKLGGKRNQGADDQPAPTDAEQLYFQYRDEIGGVITTAEQLLLKDNALQHLAGHPEEIRGVVAGLRALADKVEAAAKPLIGK